MKKDSILIFRSTMKNITLYLWLYGDWHCSLLKILWRNRIWMQSVRRESHIFLHKCVEIVQFLPGVSECSYTVKVVHTILFATNLLEKTDLESVHVWNPTSPREQQLRSRTPLWLGLLDVEDAQWSGKKILTLTSCHWRLSWWIAFKRISPSSTSAEHALIDGAYKHF